MNVPIYRAKKINSDECVFGVGVDGNFLIERICLSRNENKKIRKQKDGDYEYRAIYHHIDPTTLAINFPDMTDSQGNKIFASLSEDGKGGDVVSLEHITKTVIWCKKTQAIMLNSKSTGLSILSLYKEDIKVIGIQE